MLSFSYNAEAETPRSQGSEGFPLSEYPMKRKSSIDWINFGLLGFSFLTLGYLAFVYVDKMSYQAAEEREFDARLAASMAKGRELAETASFGSSQSQLALYPGEHWFSDGSIGRLTIDAADVSVLVGSRSDEVSLRRGAAHIAGTSWPGEPGNLGIAGHRDDVFRGLRHLRVGDHIKLETPRGSFAYAVESLRTVSPERVDVLEPVGYKTMTLVTCYPFDFIGPAPLRYIVRARQLS